MQEKELLGLILPKGVLEYFDIKESQQTETELHVTLEEMNAPPIKEEDRGKKIVSKGFKDITITDFPLRGRRSLLTFMRRYWQVEGSDKLLKRDIKLTAAGTQLEKEFADFSKEDGGRESGLAEFYRRVSADSSERV